MVEFNALLTVAELAVAVAGFSVVISVFITRGRLTQIDRSRFIWLFTTALITALLAFLPIILNQAGLSGEILWQSASSIMIAVWFMSFIPWVVLTLRKRRARLNAPIGYGEPFSLVIPASFNLGIQIANTGGWFWAPSSAYYLFGTLVWLYAAALVFVAIFLHRPVE